MSPERGAAWWGPAPPLCTVRRGISGQGTKNGLGHPRGQRGEWTPGQGARLGLPLVVSSMCLPHEAWEGTDDPARSPPASGNSL